MSGFVREDSVFVGQSASSRDEVLRFFSNKAADLGFVSDANTVYQAFLAREDMGETGMTDGFAVPHAKSPAILEPAVLVLKNDHPIEWPSFDGKPVDICIALLVPDGEAGTTHIKLLSKTAVLLMKDDFKNLMRSTDDPSVIAAAINEGIED